MFGRFDSAADWLANEDLKRRLILNPVTSADYKAISKMKRQRSATEIEGRRQAARAKRRQIAALRAGNVPAPLQGYVRTTSTFRRSIPGSTELKFKDNAIGVATDMTGGSVQNLTVIAEGTDDITRIGRKINIKK